MSLSVGCKISYGIIRRAISLTQSFCLSHSQGCSQIIHFIHNLLSCISKITTTATALLKYFSSSKALWGSWGQERSLYKYKSFCFFCLSDIVSQHTVGCGRCCCCLSYLDGIPACRWLSGFTLDVQCRDRWSKLPFMLHTSIIYPTLSISTALPSIPSSREFVRFSLNCILCIWCLGNTTLAKVLKSIGNNPRCYTFNFSSDQIKIICKYTIN